MSFLYLQFKHVLANQFGRTNPISTFGPILLWHATFGHRFASVGAEADSAAFDWNEAEAWDAEAEFYKTGARI
jgi:hypothetical protein